MKQQIERRINSEPLQIRSNPDGSIGVRGYAAVYDSPAHGEVIRNAAFNRTIANRDNIRLLVNHEGVPLASTKSGTLTVGTDDHGYWFDAPSLDMKNPRAIELASAMEREDIDQCSFAGYFTDVRNINGVDEVWEVKGTDVSIVTYPWYEDTEASLTGDRDRDRALLSMRSLDPEARADVLARLEPEEVEAEEVRETPPVDAEVPAEDRATLTVAEARALLAPAAVAA